MDLSKLPRLSETDKHTPASNTVANQGSPNTFPQEPEYTASVAARSGPESWLSAVLGIVFMMMGWTFAKFLFAKITNQPFHTGVEWQTGPNAGQEVAFFDLVGYTAHTQAAIFLFGLAMLLETVVFVLVHRNTAVARALVGLCLLLTGSLTIYNLILTGVLFQAGITPILSILVVAFGGYMAMTQWQVLKQMLRYSRA